jgi:serine/threonine protein kinase
MNVVNLTLHYIVAIKKFRESDTMEEIKKITMREVKILKMVSHKNIIHLKQSFRRKEKLHLVFEFGGRTILDVLKDEGGRIKVILFFDNYRQRRSKTTFINYLKLSITSTPETLSIETLNLRTSLLASK